MKLCTFAANSRSSFVDFVSDVEMCLQLAELAATATDSKSKAVCHDDTGTTPVFVEILMTGTNERTLTTFKRPRKRRPPFVYHHSTRCLSRAETLAKYVGHLAVFAFRSPFCQLDERARYKVGQPQVNTESLSFKNEKSIALSLGRR